MARKRGTVSGTVQMKRVLPFLSQLLIVLFVILWFTQRQSASLQTRAMEQQQMGIDAGRVRMSRDRQYCITTAMQFFLVSFSEATCVQSEKDHSRCHYVLQS